MSEALSELLAPNELLAVQQFVGQLFERYPDRIRQTMLFGSKARGASPTSIGILLQRGSR